MAPKYAWSMSLLIHPSFPCLLFLFIQVYTECLPKKDMKEFQTVTRSLVHVFLYC